MATSGQRTHLLAGMEFMLAHAKYVGYKAVRPMGTRLLTERAAVDLFARGQGIALDCSEMVTLLCRWAGLHDPTGFAYDGYGNSSSMFAHLPRYSHPASRAHTGAIVAFGPGGSVHVGMVLTPGDDPMLFSHGSSRGPIALRLSQYLAAEPQQAPATFLDVSRL